MATNESKEIEVGRDDSAANALSVMPEFDRMFDRMFDGMVERFFAPRFNSVLGDWPEITRRAATRIQETDNYYVLSAEIPGIPKEDIQISVSGNVLTVRAERREESGAEESEQGYRRSYRSFNQSFSLPTTVDPDKIEANCENGILEVVLPKTEQAQPKRIEVRSGKGGLLNRLVGGGQGEKKETSQQKGTKH